MNNIWFKKKRVQLGEGYIIQYTIFENKNIGGIWIYNWKTIKQNRFHTHAFKSICFLLSGSYIEEVLINDKKMTKCVDQWLKPRFLPYDYTHRILKAKPNTWTIVFFGKWKKTWKEYFEDTKSWVTYGWGRKVITKT